ncbi:MAG TPA: O-antigen ligase family protein, partial [Ktedonobacteraceae bacterium]|nr:O-antigen ligase family protein [Ktedonobacteraceae bacterium]
LVGILALGWLMSWVLPPSMGGPRDREKGRIPLYLLLALMVLIGVMILSITVAVSRQHSLKEIFKWLEFFVLFLLGSQYMRTRRQVWTLAAFIIAGALSQALYGYMQAFFGLGPQSFVRNFSLRIYGTFDQPNPYAGYLNMALTITLAITILGRNWLTRILAGITTCVIGGAFYLTQSRGGQVALGAALIFIILMGMPPIRVWMRIVIIGIFTLIGGMISGIIPLYLFNQLNHFLGLTGISLSAPNPQDYSTAERLAHWIAGLRMFEAHPVLGIGIGNYPDVYANYYITIFSNSLGQAHNYYINIAAETGAIGLVAYLCFVTAMLVASGIAVRQVCQRRQLAKDQLPKTREPILAPIGRKNKLTLLLHPARFLRYYQRQARFETFGRLINDRALAIGLMAAVLSICVHNLVDDLYDHSLTNLLALLLIALIRLGRIISHVPLADRQGSRSPMAGAETEQVTARVQVAVQVYPRH